MYTIYNCGWGLETFDLYGRALYYLPHHMFILCGPPLPRHRVGNNVLALTLSLLSSAWREEVIVAQLGIGYT
jgi:hypothetical protein